jgi:hypothetical protein
VSTDGGLDRRNEGVVGCDSGNVCRIDGVVWSSVSTYMLSVHVENATDPEQTSYAFYEGSTYTDNLAKT